MKKKFIIFFGITTFIIGSVLGLYFYNRYHISAPMEDINYKKEVLRDAHNLTYTLEALRPIMGPEELKIFLQENDNNIATYTPSEENLKSGKYRANLHIHTTKSDGIASVEERLNQAQHYAKKHIKNGYMVIAITDHNTVLGAKEIIRILQKNKGKYKNIKVIPGIEIFTSYKNSKIINIPVEIHVLCWCINPYNEFLNREYYKKNPKDKGNRSIPDRDFDWVIETMSKYGITGPAHPARYTSFMKEKKYPYITEMLTRYKKLNNNTKFTEGYYQSYMVTSTGQHLGKEYDKYIKHINNQAQKLGIIRTGSTDAHGKSIFKYR